MSSSVDLKMETRTPTSVYHHHRAPRTPESYFNVPESIALLNIVKSERIQSAFQSNRKNHASVWEMVAEVLNRYSARKRSAKQCCNRYENLKKIYTQLKKNPERHVRRNWPYMFLFKEIEEQRGECWGSNSKRMALIAKNQNELSYYHRRRQAAEFGALLDKQTQAAVVAQHNLLQSLAAVHSNDSNSNCKLERFLPNHFVEAQLGNDTSNTNGTSGVYDDESPLPLQATRKDDIREIPDDLPDAATAAAAAAAAAAHNLLQAHVNGVTAVNTNELKESLAQEYEKDCNGALNLQTSDNNVSMKSEPMSDGEFNPDDIQLMQTNYNGSQNYYSNNMDHNILHPDVIVDTDNLSECSSVGGSQKGKRKLSTSTDGDSTNYELIEYLKRREKRDEELLRRLDAREERLVSLLERTVVAIEALVQFKCTHHTPTTHKMDFAEKSTNICNGNATHAEATAASVAADLEAIDDASEKK
ncbi:meso18E isoform 2-T6 [Cochliomyia hominivorax]